MHLKGKHLDILMHEFQCHYHNKSFEGQSPMQVSQTKGQVPCEEPAIQSHGPVGAGTGGRWQELLANLVSDIHLVGTWNWWQELVKLKVEG